MERIYSRKAVKHLKGFTLIELMLVVIIIGALVAMELNPHVAGYLYAAHGPTVGTHATVLEKLGLEPMFDLKLTLDEGTGAALGMTFVEGALRALRETATSVKMKSVVTNS